MVVCSNMLRIKNVLITSSNFSHSFSECKLGYHRISYEEDSFCRPCNYPTFGKRCLNECNCSKHQRYDTNSITQLQVQDESHLKNASCALNSISTSLFQISLQLLFNIRSFELHFQLTRITKK
jgi:hypothetical protein